MSNRGTVSVPLTSDSSVSTVHRFSSKLGSNNSKDKILLQ